MIHTSRNARLAVIIISAWTIFQTIIHIYWVIYANLLSLCWIRPNYYDMVFMYLTYLYKNSCGSIYLSHESLFLDTTTVEDDHSFDETSPSNILYQFLNETLTKGMLPHQSSVVGRTEMYLALLFITDVVWIVTAVGLLVYAFCKEKQKFLSIIFYGPWLLCSAFVNFLDVVSAVHYGLDLVFIRDYTSWLDFVGVTNFGDFERYNYHPTSSMIPALPATVVVTLLSRIFVVWVLNIICFFVVLFVAIPDLLQTIPQPGNSPRPTGGNKLRFGTGNEMDLNSSEARIRNWQLFYGAIEANSTMASDSPSTSAGTSRVTSSADLNYYCKSAEAAEAKKNGEASYHKSTLDQKSDASSLESPRATISTRAATLPVVDPNNVPILKGHIPWSYISPEGQYVRKQHSYTTRPVPKVLENNDKLPYSTRL